MSWKKAFINGAAAISPQLTFDAEGFLNDPKQYHDNSLISIDADYKQYINPVQIRRMSRIMKMGISAAKNALTQAGVEIPDAIITGTGYGCIEDTDKFLISMIENHERLLNPTAFMQSTHNSVAGIVALTMKCMNYNFTYVHRGFSFENSIIDAQMALNEGQHNILVGAFEELSANYMKATSRIGFWKDEKIDSLDLFNSKTPGSIYGEGAAFFVLSSERNSNTYAEMQALKTIYKPASQMELHKALQVFLSDNSLSMDDIDLVISGHNGDIASDAIYAEFLANHAADKTQLCFKHLCGEYYTSGSFGFWLAAQILKRQEVPAVLKLNEIPAPLKIRRILMYNHHRNINHSFYLFSA